MNFHEKPEDAAFRLEVRTFVQASLPSDIRQRVVGFQRVGREDYVRWQNILNARGWGAPGWTPEFGGTGWNAWWRIIFEDECFAGGAPRQMPFGLSMIGPVLQKFGSKQQKDYFLPRMLDTRIWWCQGYSEPGAGSDLVSLKTRAVRDGDFYVIDGQKTWTSFAHWADWMFCLVRTGTEGRPQEGISLLLIDMKTPGVTVRPIRTLDGGADVNDVFLDNVRVPLANRVGEENRGWTYAKYLLGHERAMIAGIGMCKRLLARARALARSERHRSQPLIENERLRDRLARLEIEVMAHEWSLLRMIWSESAGQPSGPQGSVLKIRGSEIQADLAEFLMDCVGPDALGYMADALEPGHMWTLDAPEHANPLSGVYFDMRKVAIYGGTNEVQKNIIAKMLEL
jgi:alkylation response protein AidB-like acyl-CoA dehydrogenase